MATDFFAEIVAGHGFETECPGFDCIDWAHGKVQLSIEGESFEVHASPYSLGCRVSAPLVVANRLEELKDVEVGDKVLMLRGELAKEQLMPKNFTFYNPDEHKTIIHLLEVKNPLAIIAATSRNPELAGGLYPFPLIEDGDFDIPSVYMTEEEGERLANYLGKEVSLLLDAQRIPAKGYNVIARKGSNADRRIVICAHIDAKLGTPGAIDNAVGVVVLLLLAELMKDYSGSLGIELVAFNGEDYYSAPGQVDYLNSNQGRLNEILLAINIDAAGYKVGQTAYSLYECPKEFRDAIQNTFSSQEDTVEGELWYQSDHSIFIQNQIPAVAITSDRFMELSRDITHTTKDIPEIVAPDKLVDIAIALRDALLDLDRQL
jgi:aminopeptidase YwaD